MNEKKKKLFELIFKTAAREFADYGYAGARMDRIAETAKVNKATIYYHIGSKENLYNQTVEFLITRATESLDNIADPVFIKNSSGSMKQSLSGISRKKTGRKSGGHTTGGSPEPGNETFGRYIEILGKTLFGDLKLPLIMIREIVSGREYLNEATIGKFMELFKPIIALITRGQQEGRFRNKSPLLVHFIAVAGIYFFTAGKNFLVKNMAVTESGLPRQLLENKEFLLKEISDLLLHGLASSAVK